jgi:hypothetical protein
MAFGYAPVDAAVSIETGKLAVEAENLLAKAAVSSDRHVVGTNYPPGLATPNSLCLDAKAIEGGDVPTATKAGP